MRVYVYHGCGWASKPDIEENGLHPPAGHGPGVRVHLTPAEATRFARAYAAWQLYEHRILPQGLVIGAHVDESRIHLDRRAAENAERLGLIYRIDELRPCEIKLKRIDFDDLADDEKLADALELFEEITGAASNSPTLARRKIRRGGIIVPRTV